MAQKRPQEKEVTRPKKRLRDEPVGLFLIAITIILVLVILSMLGLALQSLLKQ